MDKRILLFAVIAILGIVAADTYKPIVNPYTSKLDMVTSMFSNLTVNNSLTVNGSITALGNVTASWFKGMFNWTENSPYLTFTGALLSFNETKLNSTIDAREIDTRWSITGSAWLINNSGILDANETKLNATIGAVTSPLYVNKSGDTITGNLIIAGNLTVLQQVTPVNVSSVNANGSIIPLIDNFFNLGNSTNRWDGAYAADFYGNLNASYIQNEYWVDASGDTMTGALSLGTNNLTAGNVLANINASYVQGEYWVNESGDTMSGNLAMGGNSITGALDVNATNLAGTLNASYIQNEYWVDAAGDSMTGHLNMTTHNITDVDNVYIRGCFIWDGGGQICSAP